jgi:hypothetical protein
MALLTNEQATQIYNSSVKQRIDINDAFYAYRTIGNYLGFEYSVDTVIDGIVGLDENSTPAEIETAFVTELETRTFRGSEPIGKITNF